MQFICHVESATVDFENPSKDELIISLCDDVGTQTADAVKLRFDPGRNGWVLLQACVYEWELQDLDPEWQEVAFIPAWTNRKTIGSNDLKEESDGRT